MTATVPQPYDDRETGVVFDALGHDLRFGVTADDRVYVIATDLAKAMGYRDAANATRTLEDDEKGTHLVSTLGGDQRVYVIYEDGIWELIFRSSLPGAKLIKKRVKEILREIRRTGRYESDQLTRGWEILAGEGVDYSAREAATILNRDHDIITGQNTLFAYMRTCRMLDRRNRPYASHKEHVVMRMGAEWYDADGELRIGRSQIRVTVKGMSYLHRRLSRPAVAA